MFNLLIVVEDLFLAKRLINCIGKIFSNIRLHSVAISIKEANEILQESNIDIILLDLCFSDISVKNL